MLINIINTGSHRSCTLICPACDTAKEGGRHMLSLHRAPSAVAVLPAVLKVDFGTMVQWRYRITAGRQGEPPQTHCPDRLRLPWCARH
jgi:hypothetical protein